MGTKNNQSSQNDIFSDIIEIFGIIFYETIKVLALLLTLFVNWAIKKIFKRDNHEPIELKDLKSKKCTKKPDAFGWQVKASKDFKEEDYDSTRHTMIVGPTGYGKTNLMTLLQDKVIRQKHPVVFFDPKASMETIEMFTNICENAARKVYYFNDFLDNKYPFNPLLDGNVDQIADRIVNACEWSDSYYKSVSISALKESIFYLKSRGEIVTLKKIVELFSKRADKDKIQGLYTQLESACNSEFSSLVNDESANQMSFSRLRKENACLYIGVSSLGYSETAKFFNKLLLDNLLFHCYESLKGDYLATGTPLCVFFDELSSIITPRFIDLQNKCRAAKVEITYATQCPSDLSTVSDKLMDQVFENTENLFIFKHTVPSHTEYLSKMVGTSAEDKITHMTEDGNKSNRGTSREVEKLNLHPNILRSLRIGQCIYLNKRKSIIDVLNIKEFKPQLSFERYKQMVERELNINQEELL